MNGPIKALIVHVNGTGEVREIEQDLHSLQAIVGGWLQCVPAAHGPEGSPSVGIWCDEEGKLKDYQLNRKATTLWYALSPEMAGRDVLPGHRVLHRWSGRRRRQPPGAPGNHRVMAGDRVGTPINVLV